MLVIDLYESGCDMTRLEPEKTSPLKNNFSPSLVDIPMGAEMNREVWDNSAREGRTVRSEASFEYEQLMTNANILINEGDYSWAMALLERILIRVPHHQLALERLAQCAVALKEFPLAIDCYQKLVLAYGNQYKIKLADSLYKAKENDLALDLYLDLKDTLSEKEIYPIFKRLGNIYIRKKEFLEARKYYEKALTICPMSDELRVNCGALELQVGRLDEALQWFQSAVELNSHNDRAWVGLAVIHYKRGDFDLSWANLEKALDVNTSTEITLNLYFEWGMRNNKVGSVVSKYRAAVNQYPHRDDLRMALAKAQFYLDRLKKSKTDTNIFLTPNYQYEERLKELIDE